MEKINHSVSDQGLHQQSWVDDGNLIVDSRQDISDVLEMNQRQRDSDSWQKGVKAGMAHVARIPAGVVHELMAIGINVYSAPMKDVIRGLHKLNREACLTTRKRII